MYKIMREEFNPITLIINGNSAKISKKTKMVFK